MARVLIVGSYIETTIHLRVGALQKVFISHGGCFLSRLLMARHKIHVVSIWILGWVVFCTTLSEIRSKFTYFTLLWSMFRLSLQAGILMHH